jgi:hypothetical protein
MNNDSAKKSNAGRKKFPPGEKKERIDILVKGSIIEENGGIEQTKKNIYYFLGQK